VALRFDIASATRPPRKRPGGTLVADAHLSRAGVQRYRNSDGSERIEYRPESEVFDPESMASFEMLPLTNEHPPDGEVTAENAKALSVGTTGDTIRRDGIHLASSIVVLDAAAVKLVEQGKRQLSCGYTCDLDMTPGVTPHGERYDAIQKNIRGNHVAIVDVGRAGTARVRMDAATMVALDAADTAGSITMDELKKALAELATATARADAAEKKLATVEGERDSAIAARDREAKARKDADDGFGARVTARVALEAGAVRVLDAADHAKVSAMSDVELMTAVVKHLDGDDAVAKCAGKSVDYLRARFDGALDRCEGANAAHGALRTAIVANRVDALVIDVDIDEDAARRAMNKRSLEMSRAPLSAVAGGK
jgi:uncharacterized protein